MSQVTRFQATETNHSPSTTDASTDIPSGEHLEHPKKRRFLEAYEKCGTVTSACRAAGIGRTTHFGWVKGDPEFAKAFEEAKEAFADSLEEIAFDWVREMRKNNFKGANPVILAMLLNGHRPEKYRPNQQPTDTTAVDLMAQWRAKAQADQRQADQALRQSSGEPSRARTHTHANVNGDSKGEQQTVEGDR